MNKPTLLLMTGWHCYLLARTGFFRQSPPQCYTSHCMAQTFSITHLFLAHINCRTPWMRDQIITRPLLRTKHHIKTREKHPCPKWDSNPRPQQPGGQDLCLRLHGQRDQHKQDLHWLLELLTACIHFGRDL